MRTYNRLKRVPLLVLNALQINLHSQQELKTDHNPECSSVHVVSERYFQYYISAYGKLFIIIHLFHELPIEMASESLNDTMFDVISQEIMDAFAYLIKQLMSRRDELLAEVNAKKQDYINTLFVEDENVKELTNIQSQIEQLSIKQNIPSAKIQESLVPLQKQIRNVIEPPNLKFECSYKKLSDQIRKLGSVVLNKTPLSAHYKSKKKAEIILKCTTPTAIHVDETYLYAIGMCILSMLQD